MSRTVVRGEEHRVGAEYIHVRSPKTGRRETAYLREYTRDIRYAADTRSADTAAGPRVGSAIDMSSTVIAPHE